MPDDVQVAMLRPRTPAPTPEPELPPAPAADSGIDGSAYATLSRAAERGQLARADRLRLEGVDRGAADYSRSRALLVMDAQRRDDAKAEGRYLQELMIVPENRYNPVFLSDLARWQVNEGRYDAARSSAREAEQQWARIPSAIMFAKKAEIYRAQAAAAQGLFNESGGDVARLDEAIDAWRRYEAHVAARSRDDLAVTARDAVASLEDIRERLK